VSDRPETPGGQGPDQLPSVAEVVVSSAQLLVSLAAEAIAARERLDEAALAIDVLGALMPHLERVLPAGALRGYRQALADLQLAYAGALRPQPASEPGPEPSVEPPPRPKIWTPRGDV
jgi:hypothetical protein